MRFSRGERLDREFAFHCQEISEKNSHEIACNL